MYVFLFISLRRHQLWETNRLDTMEFRHTVARSRPGFISVSIVKIWLPWFAAGDLVFSQWLFFFGIYTYIHIHCKCTYMCICHYIYIYMGGPLHQNQNGRENSSTGFAQAWGKAQSCQIFFQSDHGTMPEKTIIPSVGQ